VGVVEVRIQRKKEEREREAYFIVALQLSFDY